MEGHYSMKLGKLIKDFELEVLRGVEHYEDVLIQREDVNRPGLQLVGFFDYFDDKRLQVLGKVEVWGCLGRQVFISPRGESR